MRNLNSALIDTLTSPLHATMNAMSSIYIANLEILKSKNKDLEYQLKIEKEKIKLLEEFIGNIQKENELGGANEHSSN